MIWIFEIKFTFDGKFIVLIKQKNFEKKIEKEPKKIIKWAFPLILNKLTNKNRHK